MVYPAVVYKASHSHQTHDELKSRLENVELANVLQGKCKSCKEPTIHTATDRARKIAPSVMEVPLHIQSTRNNSRLRCQVAIVRYELEDLDVATNENGANAKVYSMPYAVPNRGVLGSEVDLNWAEPVYGKVYATIRVDNPI